MDYRASRTGESGVSPVIGVVLMVAITVILVVLIAGFVMNFSSGGAETNNADVDVYSTSDETVTVELNELYTAEEVVVSNTRNTWQLTTVGDSVEVPYDGRHKQFTVVGDGEGAETLLHSQVRSKTTAVWAESSTCDSPGYCGSTVFLNYSEIDSGRGVNVLVLDAQNGTFVSYAWYDTHSLDRYQAPTYTLNANGEPDMSSTTSCTDCVNDELLNHLNSIQDGRYVILIGDDQPGRRWGDSSRGINDAVEQKYKSMGAEFGGQTHLQYRDSWILATETGEPGKIFEKHAPNGSTSGVAAVNESFFTPYDE